MKPDLLKNFAESFFIILVIPYFCIAYAPSIMGLGLAIMLFMAVLPVYFIISPLRFDPKSVIIWFIPLFNAVMFLLSVKIIFNNSAEDYLPVYLVLAYLAIIIKYVYKSYKH